MADRIELEPIPHDGLEPMVAAAAFDSTYATALGRVAGSVESVRKRIAEATELADVAERVYIGHFLPDVEAAARAALDLEAGGANIDPSTFGPNTTEQQIRDYLEPFVVQDPSAKYHFPRLWLPASAVIPFNGKEYTLDPSSWYNMLTPYKSLLSFRPDLQLPQLIDPQPRTFGEFEELSTLDPGHAEQVKEAYRMAVHEQHEQYPGIHYKDPIIIRAVATLPTGTDYATEFLPQLELGDVSEAWDPRIIVGGALNPSGNFLVNEGTYKHDRIVLSVDGKEAAFRVTRPKPGERDLERSLDVVPRTDHEYDSIAIILFPHRQHKAPRRSYDSPVYFDRSVYGGGATRSVRMSHEPAVGAANVSAGTTGGFAATKRGTNSMGDRILPVPGGQPLIYSIRLLTVSA